MPTPKRSTSKNWWERATEKSATTKKSATKKSATKSSTTKSSAPKKSTPKSKIGLNKTTKKRVTESEKRIALINAEKFGYDTYTEDKNKKNKAYKQRPIGAKESKIDKKRQALPPGRRTTVWNTEYWETRLNRSDKRKK